MIIMRAIEFLTIAILAVALLLTSCKGPDIAKSGGRDIDHTEVLLTVLSDMVTNADQAGKMVRFVDIPEESVGALRVHCGNRYIIFPITSAERRTYNNGTISDAEQGIYLKNSHKEGVILRVEDARIMSQEAEAVGTFSGRLNGASFRYTLTRTNSGWRIVSVQNIIAF
jgi:hypothetical protein